MCKTIGVASTPQGRFKGAVARDSIGKETELDETEIHTRNGNVFGQFCHKGRNELLFGYAGCFGLVFLVGQALKLWLITLNRLDQGIPSVEPGL